MNEARLRRLVRQVRSGERSTDEFVEHIRRLPYAAVGDARLDLHRRLRRGLPEAVFCEGKRPDQLIRIANRLIATKDLVLLTRLDSAVYSLIRAHVPQLRYDPIARLGYVPAEGKPSRAGLVAVLTGGTSDMPVAEEAAKTLELLGSRVARVYDVGVAGLHRLLDQWDLLRRARVIVVVAGMEGALPSVVAGLAACPVLAVPTSIGYGASFQGIAALLAMLNSCSPGVGVMNIDNGFGAAYLAHTINRPARKR